MVAEIGTPADFATIRGAMTLTITNPDLEALGLTEAEVLREVALSLFAAERLTIGQASRLARISQEEFLELLATRRIPIHYGVDEVLEDLETLRRLPTP